MVPVAVVACACVASADPVNVGAATVPVNVAACPVNVSAGTVPLEPVNVCVCVASAEPVKVCADTVRFGAVALQAVVAPVPAAMLVAAQLPDVALAPFVPAGVPAVIAAFVPAGVKLAVPLTPVGV